MQIILTSTGTECKEVKDYIVSLTLNNNKNNLLFISTAGNPIEHPIWIDEEKMLRYIGVQHH